MVSFGNINTNNIIKTEQVIFRNVNNNNLKKGHELKDNKEGKMGEFEERKEKIET